MKISRNTVATVSFIVTDKEDRVVGRTDPKKPVNALIGFHYLVPGLEKALDGHEKGDEFTVTLNPADSYGEFDDSLVQTLPRSMFGDFPLEEGNVFEADTSLGPRAVVVKEIKENEVIVDGNHPLAGQTLTFFVTVEDVRAASAEEIAHGHVHHDGVCPSEEGEHHCCCGGHGHHHHHDDEDSEHHCCCGGHGHHHDDDKTDDHEDGEHHCCCGGHGHHHDDQEKTGKESGEHHCCCGRHHHED